MDGTRTAVESQRERARDLATDRGRVIVERVWPQIDGGRFPIKRTIGERVTVSADIFADGHDLLAGVVRYRYRGPDGSAPQQSSQGRDGSLDPPSPDEWQETPLTPLDNDRWEGSFTVTELGAYRVHPRRVDRSIRLVAERTGCKGRGWPRRSERTARGRGPYSEGSVRRRFIGNVRRRFIGSVRLQPDGSRRGQSAAARNCRHSAQ